MATTDFNIGQDTLMLSPRGIKALADIEGKYGKIKDVIVLRKKLEKEMVTLYLRQNDIENDNLDTEKERLDTLRDIKKQIDEINQGTVEAIQSGIIPRTSGPSPAPEWNTKLGRGKEKSMFGGWGRGKGGEREESVWGLAVKFVIFDKILGAIQRGLSESQHLTMIATVLSKTVGLMVDLLLLPFLPLITFFLMSIMKSGIALVKFLTGSGGGTEKGKEAPGVKGGKEMATIDLFGLKVDIPTLMSTIASLVIGAIVGALVLAATGSGLWAVVAGVIVGALVLAISTYIVNLGYKAGDAFMSWLRDLVTYTIDLVKGFFTFGWLKDPWKGLMDAFHVFFRFGWLLNPFNAIMMAFTSFFSFGWLGTDPFSAAIKLITGGLEGVATAISDFFRGIIKTLTNMGLDPVGTFKGLMGFAEGGVVPGAGPRLAVVHGGETVIPAGKSVGGNTFNFYGYQDDQFIRKVKDVLRQEGTRYNV